MTVKITLEFAGTKEALRALQVLHNVTFDVENAKVTVGDVAHSVVTQQVEPAAPVPVQNPAVAAPAPQPEPAAPAPAGKSVDDCAASFRAHVGRGGGRTAMTARDAILKVLPSYQNFKALTDAERATAIEAMDAA